MSRRRILFYVERSLHLPFLEPIQAYLQANDLADTAFSAPPFFAGTSEVPQWGLPDDIIRRLQAKAPFHAEPEAFDPHVTIVADACHYRIPHLRHVINVGHGMICKGAFYTDTPIIRRENLSQMLLVPGPMHRRRVLDNVFIPVRVTGFIKSDQLFSPEAHNRATFCSRMGIDPAKRIVLFAPTYNPELSAIHCLQEGIRKVADNDTVLLIKLHNMTDQRFKDLYANIASVHPNIFYLEDADYSGMMHAADLMISDVSSIFIEFLLLDKPVVLFDSPRLKEFPLYREQDIEYMARDAAVLVNSLDSLLRAVRDELAQPERRSAVRRRYAMALDYGLDGNCARRAAEAILDWVHGRNQPEPVPLRLLLLAAPETTASDLAEHIAHLQENAPEHRLQIYIFGGCERLDIPDATHVHTGSFSCPELYDHLRATTTSTVVMAGTLRVPYAWPRWLENHLRWNPDADAVKALTDRELAIRCMQQMAPSPRPITNSQTLQFGLRVTGIGQSLAGERMPSDCILLRDSLCSRIPEALPAETAGDFITALGLLPQLHSRKTRMAVDCYMYSEESADKIMEKITMLRRTGRMQEAMELLHELEKSTSA